LTIHHEATDSKTVPGPAPAIDDRFTVLDGEVYLTGVQALVRVLIDQRRADRRRGRRTAGYVSGYPGSPLGGVDLEMERRRKLLAEHDVVHQPGLNEDLAATAIWGAQTVTTLPGAKVEGVFAMWYGKAPGVDRSGDAFRHGNIGGVGEHGGVIAVAGDDPDARSTNFPTSTIGAFADWAMPVLFPGSTQDVVDLGLHGYALSRAAGLWVSMRMVTDLADGSGIALVGPDRVVPTIPTVEYDGGPFRPKLRVGAPGAPMKEAERDLFGPRTELAAQYIKLNRLNPVVVEPSSARLGIVAVGKAYNDLRRALDLLGLDDAALVGSGIRLKKVVALAPVATAEWRDFAAGLATVIVIEEKRPFVESAMKEALYGTANAPEIVGKRDERGAELFPIHGELGSDRLARVLGSYLSRRSQIALRMPEPLREHALLPLSTSRTPYFCSGCPHNRSLVVPEGSVVGSGIGCHILQLIVPREEYGTLAGFTQMGGEGAQWVGAAPFTSTPHIFQNIGDGTFAHSGSLGVRYAIATGTTITFKLLVNSAVGMTGGQDVTGGMTVPALTRLLQAEGVVRTIVTTDDVSKYRHRRLPGNARLGKERLASNAVVWHRDRLLEAQELLASIGGVTVLLHDQQCAAEKRRLRKRAKQAEPTRRIMVNERVCEGCGDCNAKSQCLSVQPVDTEFGRKTRIDQSSCNLDYSCADGDCPSFLVVETKRVRKRKKTAPTLDIDLPEPTLVGTATSWNIHMAGIGGTGVVTASQILATAAVLDGFQVRDLDLTGASQKAGPVVSQLQLYQGDEPPATTIPDGAADLFLGFDLLGAVAPANLAKASQDRTVVVASLTRTPTGQMALDPATPFPALAELRRELDGVSRAGDNVYLDAEKIARSLFGTHMVANSVMLGAAYQCGAVPISEDSLHAAIRLNGTAVDQNLDAFRWGRAVVSHPELIDSYVTGATSANGRTANELRAEAAVSALELSSVVRERVERLAADLVGYQGTDYADRFVDRLSSMQRDLGPAREASERLLVSAAEGLHHLMAYKDEYEVARLHLLSAASAAVTDEFGDGAVVSWRLHPPILRTLGMQRKITLGPWFRPAFVALRSARRLRGTPADVFGYARVRRVERALVDHYGSLLQAATKQLTPQNADTVDELARSAFLVRGYEHIKLRNVVAYLESVDRLMTSLGALPPPAERLAALLAGADL
jgi:indolepyruvate ferredoxin oxidoreductase